MQSAFEMHCPACGVTLSAVAVVCACGHVFNALYMEDPRRALEGAVREEGLIEEYLRARVEQAAAIARGAARAALRNPKDEHRLRDAIQAQQAARAARAELAKQRLRTTQARAHLRAHGARGAATHADLTTAPRPPEGSWQAVIVREALKAKSLQGRAGRAADEMPVHMRERPSKRFRAAQAQRAEQIIRAAGLPPAPSAPLSGVEKGTAPVGSPGKSATPKARE